MEEPKKENKLFNVFLLGDIKSDKNKLIQQYILNNNQNNTDAEGSNEENPKTENTSEITQSFEIHGETIKMKILEDPQADQALSPNADNSTKPQGIILFYNVTDRDSFDKLKQIISNIMDMNNEMPIVIVGNTSDKSERTVPFEEAKNFADNYGLKYHETTLENNCINMKDVFNDLGEQVLYQDILEKNNANDKTNEKEELTNEKEKEESNNEKEELTNEKEKEESNNEKEELTNEKEELSNEKEKEENNEKEQSNEKELSNEKEQSNENNKRKDKDIRSKSKDIKGKKTSLQRKREKEVREKRLKREQEMQLWYKKREREGIELKKKKALEDKIKLKEKIREDKMLQKQREKEVKEEFLNEKKEKYEKSKKEKEEGEKKNMLEKEKNKMILEKKRKNEKETLKKLLEENEQNDREYLKQKRAKLRSPQGNRNKQRQNFGSSLEENNHLNSTISDFTPHEEKSLNESQILKRHQTLSEFYKKKENTSKKKANNLKTAKSKSTMKTKKSQKKQEVDDSEYKLKEEKEKKEEMERKEKEEKLIQEQMKLRNELKEKYLNNNCNIYRCLYCYEIPIIKINEFNHQIEIYCNCSKYNNNTFSYKYFEEKSLDHPIDNNICCGYCKKNINELDNENLYLNFCNICNDIVCSKDESTHKNDKHSHYKELKDKYKNFQTIKSEKTKSKGSGNKNKSFTPSKNQGTLKKSAQTPKKEKEKDKDKKPKEETKSSKSSKKNMALSGAKSNKKTKDNNDKKKNDESINTIETNEENKSKVNEEKIPIYLNDSCCFEHGKVYNSYCHDCFKNICPECEGKEHKEHNIQNLNKIILEDDKLLLNLKQSLEKDINDLKDVNNYFNELIEKIKEQFLYFYSLKQKEIEIKQKIIKDYEVIKYNYNCIQNLYNINYKNNNINKNSIKSNLEKLNNNNNKDLLSKLKLIFDYLDESIEPTNLPNYYNNYNKILISNGENEITDVTKLDTNDLAVSFFNGYVNIYDSIYFNQKMSCEIFENNKGINQIIQLKNGDLACTGFEKIKIVNINLNNKNYSIKKEITINNGYFNIIKELSNNYLITYDTSNALKIWYNYKLINEIKNNINIDSLLTLRDDLLISSSSYDKRLNLYHILINKKNKINLNCSTLDNLAVIDGKNSIAKLNNNYLVAIYEEKKIEDNNNEQNEKLEECKNNEDSDVENGICLIEINPKNKLKIIKKIKNKEDNGVYINIINYINNVVLLLNDLGYIELWSFDNINKRINIMNQFKAVDSIYSKRIRSILFIEDNKKIILQNYKNLICLSHE